MSSEADTNTGEDIKVPNFAVIVHRIGIARPTEQAWSTIGNYADAGKFLKVASRLLSGGGDVGSVRLVGDTIVEVMVGRGPTSYTYVQTKGPMAAAAYHGSVSLEPAGADRSTLIYTVSYDTAGMDAVRRDQDFNRLTARFQGMVEAMKEVAEAAPA
ncbi:hypothetical protein J2X72_001389 [Phyllobacterium sp. 1468]|uniref:SRPBCC family protein n=1 Tax=Phyllobacterium sp. 1468 TaxID=2817759 RepID=UPI00285FDFE7|nr:SRPBCC family protein [Phyllobacterium sp. 1468]MDR6632605.1 hypothetical protein [Phyllobacterium sp. 1468]